MEVLRAMRDYKKLAVWSKAHELILMVYRLTREFPQEEHYGLTSQMRRAAISIPSNIAEGYGRGSDKDFARFLHIASGSNCELDNQIPLAGELGYAIPIDINRIHSACEEVRRMLAGLLNRLEADSRQPGAST